MRHILLPTLLLLCSTALPAQTTLVRDGAATGRIVLADTTRETRRAAEIFNTFVKRIAGVELPVVAGPAAEAPGSVVLGGHTTRAGYDGFAIESAASAATDRQEAGKRRKHAAGKLGGRKSAAPCQSAPYPTGSVRVLTGGGRGVVYGVCELLAQGLGVRYYAYEACTFTPSRDIIIPAINTAQTPAFRYRQTQSYGCDDALYKDWFRLREPREVFAANMWVHTFNRILPASRYGASHPEWYSLIKGKRQPGDHSQWCLTNPEVFEAACHNIDSIFRANPGLTLLSVSQNDGNDTYCHCPACAAVDAEEGSPAGNIIRFLNKIAQRFPDKQFSTLAYLYSMQPPRHTKPLPNVNIMLCDIDCKRELPLTDTPSGQEFVRALEGWSRITDNIFVWDYGINFDNVVAPFPNFHVLAPNIRLFHKNHATMLFEQVNGTRGTDFAELRAYMLSRLMWNPALDADSLRRDFLQGYYGAAAEHLDAYLTMRQGAMVSSHTPLWIYDSPVTHKDGMLCTALCQEYDRLFDKAEQAVGTDSTLLARVQMARLPLRYAELEIARTMSGADRAAIEAQLDRFDTLTRQLRVPTLNERHNRPADYCRLYRQRYLPRANDNLAAGAKITWQSAPDAKYLAQAETSLTDGLYGGTTYVEGWTGWEGRDADFMLDMGAVKDVRVIETDFLHQLGAWILLPRGGSYAVSTDGTHFQDFGTFHFDEDRDVSVKFVPGRAEVARPVRARYVRVHIDALGACPAWHYGVGYPAWTFIDEVRVAQ